MPITIDNKFDIGDSVRIIITDKKGTVTSISTRNGKVRTKYSGDDIQYLVEYCNGSGDIQSCWRLESELVECDNP